VSAAPTRGVALLALVVLLGTLVGIAVATTPWRPLTSPPAGVASVEPTRDFTPEDIAREDAYHREVRPPAYLGIAVGLLAAAALGFTPLGARLVTAAARPLGGGWVWQVLVGGLAVALVTRLVTLPFDARAELVLRRYGLSTQTWLSWLSDQAKGFGLSTGLLLIVLVGLVALARAMPRWWWVPAAAGAALLVVVVSFAYPLVVEPVFNKFTPMRDGPLRTSLLELARADGVAVDEVLVADASRRTTALNAYVSGFGATKRIVVYDTLLRRADDAEVRSVVAHELGHAERRDVLHGTLLGALGAAAAACFLFVVLTWEPLLRRADVTSAGDPRVLALLLAVVGVVGFATAPAQLLISRRVEARADVHALDLTRDPATFIRMQHRLAVQNLSDVDPPALVYGLFASHPSAPQRMALARTWARSAGVDEPAGLCE
jgi:STE24 endopeptidase